MTKWEYKAITLNIGISPSVDEGWKAVLEFYENKLNGFGKDGWELAAVFPNGTIIFKRQE